MFSERQKAQSANHVLPHFAPLSNHKSPPLTRTLFQNPQEKQPYFATLKPCTTTKKTPKKSENKNRKALPRQGFY
jgi:hypothetical protein